MLRALEHVFCHLVQPICSNCSGTNVQLSGAAQLSSLCGMSFSFRTNSLSHQLVFSRWFPARQAGRMLQQYQIHAAHSSWAQSDRSTAGSPDNLGLSHPISVSAHQGFLATFMTLQWYLVLAPATKRSRGVLFPRAHQLLNLLQVPPSDWPSPRTSSSDATSAKGLPMLPARPGKPALWLIRRISMHYMHIHPRNSL
jgi:hypothetical protein